jgi:hypothetical protein
MKVKLAEHNRIVGTLLVGAAAVLVVLTVLMLSKGSTAVAASPEICDGVDNNGNAQVDEGFPDTNHNGVADCVDTDDDGDGVLDSADNCPLVPNPSQADSNGNGIGDACDGNGPITTNPPSSGIIVVDGQFGPPAGEWSDITPVTFFKTNAKVYAGVDNGHDAVYLMYDFGLSTTPLNVGEEVGPISFKLGPGEFFDVFIKQGGPNTNLGPYPGSSQGGTGDTVRVLLNGAPFNDGGCDVGAVDFNSTSPNFVGAHNLAELEVGLHGLGPNGCYSPEPAFWSATIPAVLPLGDPPVLISQAFFNINPVTFVTTIQPVVEGPPTDPTCSDGLDNDGDGNIDSQDPDCRASVGGITELAVDQAGPRSFGHTIYILIAGLAAAAVVLGAGGWHARKRWFR